jgi:hypothetical protein
MLLLRRHLLRYLGVLCRLTGSASWLHLSLLVACHSHRSTRGIDVVLLSGLSLMLL